MKFVYNQGGIQTEINEWDIERDLRNAETVYPGPLSLPAKGFQRGVVELAALNLREFEYFCESKGFKVTIQIDK